jgi:hypothetical protein
VTKVSFDPFRHTPFATLRDMSLLKLLAGLNSDSIL